MITDRLWPAPKKWPFTGAPDEFWYEPEVLRRKETQLIRWMWLVAASLASGACSATSALSDVESNTPAERDAGGRTEPSSTDEPEAPPLPRDAGRDATRPIADAGTDRFVDASRDAAADSPVVRDASSDVSPRDGQAKPDANVLCGNLGTGNLQCDVCLMQHCCNEMDTCAANVACYDLLDCLAACGDSACEQACAASHPTGIPAKAALYTCAENHCLVVCR